MKKILVLIFGLITLAISQPSSVSAQMMGRFPYPTTTPSNSDTQVQQQEEQEGKNLFDQLNNKVITCQQITDGQFEKIGEYFMGQSTSNTATHILINNRMKSMMGDQGEEQMHIAWGKRGTGCDTNAQFLQSTRGGVWPMMGWGYGGMMNNFGWGIFGVLGFLVWLIVLVDLVLVGVWLWKQIQKK